MAFPLPIHRMRAFALVCIIAACVTACSVLPPREIIHTWQPPESANVAAATMPLQGISLRVDTPDANGMLEGRSIVVMPETGQVSVYKGARWSDVPAMLVRNRLVDAFMAAGLPLVTTSDDRLASDYVLGGTLRAFQSEYHGGAPVVTVRFDATVRRSDSRSPLAAHSFVITEQPTGVEVPAVVQAFGAADDELAQQVVAWTLTAVNRDRQSPPEPAAAQP